MITNKDIRVENGNLVLNGDKFPLDGQLPETIMEIVEDNSDTTPTENSTAPITSGGAYTALGAKQNTLTFDAVPTENSTNPVESGGVYDTLASKRSLSVSSTIINFENIAAATSESPFVTPHEGFVRFEGSTCLCINTYRMMKSEGNLDYKGMWLPKGVSIYFIDGTPTTAQWFNCSNE